MALFMKFDQLSIARQSTFSTLKLANGWAVGAVAVAGMAISIGARRAERRNRAQARAGSSVCVAFSELS